MGEKLITSIVTVLTAIVGVAIIAVLVSKNSNTTGVLQAGGSAFSSALGTALSPISGSGFGSFTGGGGLPSLQNF
jgi:hypothetical protein